MSYPPASKNITAGKLVRALERDGFILARRSRASFVFLHSKGNRVVVHYHHAGQTFPLGTLHAMLQDAGWTTEDLKRLKLVPKRDP